MASAGAQPQGVIEARSKFFFSDSGARTFVLCLFLVIPTLAVYYPVHRYAFVNFDDNAYVYDNPRVTGPLDWSNMKWAFTHPYCRNYDPLTFLSHSVAVHVFQLDAGRHHDINVVLHLLNAVLLFWVLRRATGFSGRSFMVAALFALHPLNVENVAWIAEQKTMLSTLFFFLALGAYHWYAERPRLRRMGVVALLYGLGLLAKPQVITLPFVLLLWDYWPLRRMFNSGQDTSSIGTKIEGIAPCRFSALLKEKIPLFVIAFVDAVLTMLAEVKGSSDAWPYPFSIQLGNAILSYARYLGKALWPVHLAVMYLHPGHSLRWWQVWLALLLLVAVSTFVVMERERRYLLVGWLWLLGTMIPTIGLVQFDVFGMADRYAYIAFVGLFIMICWGMSDWAQGRRLPRVVLPVASVTVLLALSVATRHQVEYWSDSVTLWTHTVEVTHRNWVAESFLADAFQRRGQVDEAILHYSQAAEYGDADANLHIAFIEHQRGDLRRAIRYYEKVLAVSKDDEQTAQVLANMGHAYSDLGDDARAAECYAAAMRPRPLPPSPPITWRDWRAFIRERLLELRPEDRSSQP
jgi:tetratricopeptide (TPR) repeat protein